MRSLPITKYFEIIHPEYVTLQVIPHTSCRNYNSASIIKSFTQVYRSILKRIQIYKKKLIVQSNMKCSYVIRLTQHNMEFYFIVPKIYEVAIKEKITQTWQKATILNVESISPTEVYNQFNPHTTHYNLSYQLYYRNQDYFSSHTDRRSNDLLNNIVNTMDIMTNDDQVLLVFNFMPYYSSEWSKKCKYWHRRYMNSDSISKYFSLTDTLKNILIKVVDVVDSVTHSFFGTDSEIPSVKGEVLDVLGIREQKIHEDSIAKAKKDIIRTQGVVISSSSDKTACENNALAVCQSFRVLDSDNEIKYKRFSNKLLKNLNLYKYYLSGVDSMLCSTDECQNYVQLPGKEILNRFRSIVQTNIEQTKIPDELLSGYINIGKATFKGKSMQTYFSTDLQLATLPLVLVGPMGAGKTYMNRMLAKDMIQKGEGVIVIDYIKNCEFSSEVEAITPKDKLLVIDLVKESDLQSIAYNEYKITGTTPFDIYENANLHQQQVTVLIDSVFTGQPLTGQMRKYFTSAANIVLLNDNMSLKNVVRCLEDYDTRQHFISKVPTELYSYVEEDIDQLKQLDSYDDKTDTYSTKTSKIEHIMDRVNCLRENARLRLMFNKSSKNNVDFAKAMDDGKVILIKMRADKFRTEHVRNILTTFFISKIWLACNIRGITQPVPRRYHIFLDEIFQAPTAYKPLANILRECRKFQLQLNFTAHQLSDLGELKDGLKSAGASYILLQKTDKQNFIYLKDEFEKQGFTIDDLFNLKRFHSLNLINYSDGYCAYEADLTRKS